MSLENAHAAGVLLTHGERALFLKRSEAAKDHPGEWCCPGGSIEAGETPEQAARRETQEETLYAPGDLSQIDEGNGFVTFRQSVDDEFTPTLNDEHTEAMWASLSDPPQPLHPGTAATLQKLTVGTALDKREYSQEGWYEVSDNPLSTVGVYKYSGRSIGGDADPNTLYGVYRSAEELSNPETLESFRLTPWTDDHPDALLGDPSEGFVAADSKGVHGVIGEQTYFKDGTLFGNIKVFSQSLARKIADGKRELSCGYHCKFIKQDGVYEGEPYQYAQVGIRGNHLSSVDHGRMGSAVRVLDSAECFTFALDMKESVVAEDAWSESDHPRADNGEFGKGGGSSAGKSAASKQDDEFASFKDNGKGEYEFAGKTNGESKNPWDYSKGAPKYGSGPNAAAAPASKSTKLDPAKIKAAQEHSARIAKMMGFSGEDCSLDADTFNRIADSLENAMNMAGKDAAAKGKSGQHSGVSTMAKDDIEIEKGTKGVGSGSGDDASEEMKKAAADRASARDARDAMRAKDEMSGEEEEGMDAAECADDAAEEKEDEKDDSKEARDRRSARDRRAGARDQRAADRARDAKDAKEEEDKAKEAKDKEDMKGKGMDADEVSALVDARVKAQVADVIPSMRREAASKHKLYQRLSPVIGAFDHDEMTLTDMAAYGLQKLDAPKADNPVVALDYLLVGRSQAPVARRAALDKSDSGFMHTYLNS